MSILRSDRVWIKHYVGRYCDKFLSFVSGESSPSEDELDQRFFCLPPEGQLISNEIIWGFAPTRGFCERTRGPLTAEEQSKFRKHLSLSLAKL